MKCGWVPPRRRGDAELGLDTARSDDLNDLEGVGSSGDKHTLNKEGLGPIDQVLAKVTNTDGGVPGPNRPRGQDGDQETLQCRYIYYAEQ